MMSPVFLDIRSCENASCIGVTAYWAREPYLRIRAFPDAELQLNFLAGWALIDVSHLSRYLQVVFTANRVPTETVVEVGFFFLGDIFIVHPFCHLVVLIDLLVDGFLSDLVVAL